MCLHVGDDAVSGRAVVCVLLELEGEVVDVVEGDVLEVVDQVVVRHVSELLAQRHVAARVHLSISIQY